MSKTAADAVTPEKVRQRWRQAKERRANWEAHWREAYEFTMPQHDGALALAGAPRATHGRPSSRLFDGTAPDAVDQLAASLLARLTPPWSVWFGLTPGPIADESDRHRLAEPLERAATVLKSHFDRSNFAVEVHQCYLDLVTAGTACLLLEEAAPGETSALRFTAVPLGQVAFEEGPSGRLDTTFRRSDMTLAQLRQRFPRATLPAAMSEKHHQPNRRFPVIEAVLAEAHGYDYMAFLDGGGSVLDGASAEAVPGNTTVLARGHFELSPFLNFRWLKVPGEIYGRSPVMKALPDIKTANKVVELTLKNASIAVTGIWQADDDGVLNPATIKLVPGTIIPKAIGSAGLQPLETPGRFDVSDLVLEQLRGRIRHALLADKLEQIDGPRMTATEVIERAAEMARLLGATYGRLQSELLTPLVLRALSILIRRGEIAPLTVDGRLIDLRYQSPLARQQAHNEVQSALQWLETVAALGPQAQEVIDGAAAARWLARAYGVPDELLRDERGAPDSIADSAATETAADNPLNALLETVAAAMPEGTSGGGVS